ncbi:MAG: alpha-1,2-fucosyltransferase [Selenomonadaceae bacterium]|nr:alpha-1,2-fucosyltransferase [Selenomonadaceae bacterium]
MIVTKLGGGLGNQLFQYAVGRYLANKHNTELKIVKNWFETTNAPLAYYQLDEFNIQKNFVSEEEVKDLQLIQETRTSFIPETLDAPDNIVLSGYWQSGKYFKDIRDILLKELTLKNPLGKISSQWKEKILSAECAVSMHVRRGDYMTPGFRNHSGTIPFSFYYECISILKSRYPQMTLFIFSNELDFVGKNFKFDVPVEYVKDCEKGCEEIFLMSCCKHNIIANSTFSWWGAWLNQNPDKEVFAPDPWHKDGWGGHDVVPENWTEIQVDFDENPMFAPTLSIIIYVENDSTDIPLTLQSVLSQAFKDYEIIVVNSGTDDSGRYCRQFATVRNFTFLKTSHLTKKSTALNKAVECSRGDYILFLNAKEIIISNMTLYIAQVLTELFNYYIGHGDKGKRYISYEDYVLKYSPNIFCSTSCIIEDNNGSMTIGAIENKKFSVQTDSQFQELKGVTEVNINGRDKLIMLASKQINNHLGTKFFKRSFLNENNIRFDEKLSAENAELKFLVDTFIHTEKISFIPQVFYGRLVKSSLF